MPDPDPLKDHVVFVITERDIVDLDDPEFAALWEQLGKIARARGARAPQEKTDGEADPEQRGYARGFAQGIAFAKARRAHADRDPDPQEPP